MKKKILLALSVVVIMTVLFAISISAAEPVETWDISATKNDSVTAYLYADSENEGMYTLTISGVGNMKIWNRTSDVPWYSSYCSKITSVTIENGVTSIGSYAFYECTSLTNVTIPDSVTSIGYHAFYNCNSLTSVVIGDSVTSIGKYAFSRCTSLTSVEIGDSVTSIGSNAFHSCDSLTSVNYLGTIERWCNISFDGSDANPVYYAEKLYLNGELLTELVIPSTVTEIKNYAFYNCDSLTSVVIGDGVTSIGSSAFYSCDSLTSVEIGEGVTSIGSHAFTGCDSLTSVNYLGTIEQWCNISFGNYYANPLYNGAKLYLNGELVTELVIPNTVTEIKPGAFYRCTSLTSVVIPDSVTSIGSYAFYRCTSLTIYCEAQSEPSGWSSSWNYSNRPVVWGYFDEESCLEKVFTFKGYSFGFAGQISVGFDIDYEAKTKYEEKTGKTLEIGVLFAGYDNLGGKQPLDQNGQAIVLNVGKVIKADLTTFNYPSYDFMLTDVDDIIKDVKLVIAAYIYDGDTVKYVQENGLADTVSGISYNEANGNTSEGQEPEPNPEGGRPSNGNSDTELGDDEF